jgi:hypothetical protein
MATTKRPATCGEMFAADPALGAQNCKRLPRHGGEHRGHLTQRAERRAAAAKVAKVAAPKAANVTRKRAKVTGQQATKTAIAAMVREARAAVGQPRGRLNAAKRRAAIAYVTLAADEGRTTVSIALGAVVTL